MKLKKEYIALAVVIVALLLYILLKNTNRTHYSLPEFDKIENTDITKLVITRSDEVVTLERRDESWTMQPQGYLADQTQVDKMLDAVSNFTLSTLVSESKNYTQYELGDQKKITLEIFSGDEAVRKYDIGKTASTYRHTFVRLDGDHRVYQAVENIRQPFDLDTDRLRDKIVAKVEKDFVKAISMSDSAGTLKILKNEPPPVPLPSEGGDSVAAEPPPPWQTENGRAADEQVIINMLNTLTNLKCDKYIDGSIKEDFVDPIFTLEVQMDGTGPLTLDVFEKQEDNKYPAVSSQNDYPFLLSEWQVKRFMKKPDEVIVKKEEGEQGTE